MSLFDRSCLHGTDPIACRVCNPPTTYPWPDPTNAEIATLRSRLAAVEAERDEWRQAAESEASLRRDATRRAEDLRAALAREVTAAEKRAEERIEILSTERSRAAESRLAEALAVLREVEWEGQHMGRGCCPMCAGLMDYSPPFKHEFVLKDDVIGHRPDCRLAALLKEG